MSELTDILKNLGISDEELEYERKILDQCDFVHDVQITDDGVTIQEALDIFKKTAERLENESELQ